MYSFVERDTTVVQRVIDRLSRAQAEALDASLEHLTVEQRCLVRRTLFEARLARKLSDRNLDLLSNLLDKWSNHSLAMKLVLIAYIDGLSDKNNVLDSIVPDALPDLSWAFECETAGYDA
jgi:hypothetical protein